MPYLPIIVQKIEKICNENTIKLPHSNRFFGHNINLIRRFKNQSCNGKINPQTNISESDRSTTANTLPKTTNNHLMSQLACNAQNILRSNKNPHYEIFIVERIIKHL